MTAPSFVRPASRALARTCAASGSRCAPSALRASAERHALAAGHAGSRTSLQRAFATSSNDAPTKPSIANIAEVRKQLPGTSMLKAREALTASGNDVGGALLWLDKDMQTTGAKKASKVGDRVAKEGAVSVCILADGVPTSSEQHAPSGMQVEGVTIGARAGIVELNCETDFVGRNDIFQELLRDIAHTVALFPTLAMETGTAAEMPDGAGSHVSQRFIDIPTQQLLDFPLLPQPDAAGETAAGPSQKTVGAAIIDAISRLGERIHLARASALSSAAAPPPSAPRRSATSEPQAPWLVASAFMHGSQQPVPAAGSQPIKTPGFFLSSGKTGSLLLTRVQRNAATSGAALRKADGQGAAYLAALRGLTRSLARQTAGMPTRTVRAEANADPDVAELALYKQPFMMRLASANLPGVAAPESNEEPVGTALKSWGQAWLAATPDSASAAAESGHEEPIEVLELRRWKLGEPFMEAA